MTRWFEAHTIAPVRPVPPVEPTVVVEVAFDVILRSNRHKSGSRCASRASSRLRPDKSPDEIDTIETVSALYRGPPGGRRAPGDRRRQDGPATAD